MKPLTKPIRTPEQCAVEEAIRAKHATNPIRQRPASVIAPRDFMAMLELMARFKAVRESRELSIDEVARRMGVDTSSLASLEAGQLLNPTLATLHQWAEALGRKLEVELT